MKYFEKKYSEYNKFSHRFGKKVSYFDTGCFPIGSIKDFLLNFSVHFLNQFYGFFPFFSLQKFI